MSEFENYENLARRRVEDLLRSGRLASLASLIQKDEISIDALALDLAMHQVEIEVQAEQLRQANAALEAERRKFETIFFDMPVAATLVNLQSSAITSENRKMRRLFPRRYAALNNTLYLRHFGETRFDQDRISLALAECRTGGAGEVKGLSLIDLEPDHYMMCDIRMARLDIADNADPCILCILEPHARG
jgi:hypothetical protein